MVILTGPLIESKAYVKIYGENDKIYINYEDFILKYTNNVILYNSTEINASISQIKCILMNMMLGLSTKKSDEICYLLKNCNRLSDIRKTILHLM